MAKLRREPEREQRDQPAPPADVFTSLLFVSVGATILAVALLVLALARYDWVPGPQ
jgi:hypothetical protein